ncbi:MAG: PAS domain-containing protein [Methanomicrobiales archaeon]|nr:PAS domain-containing protein [Methanomicrobiales archaeon]
MQDAGAQESPAEPGQSHDDRIRELQAEIDTLRRENEALRLADAGHRRSEEALRRENEQVGAILSALDTGQSLIDQDMTIVWVNQKTRDLFPGHDPIGDRCYRLFEGMDRPCEVCASRIARLTGEVTKTEKYVPYRGRWLSIVAQPVKDATGRVTHILESFADITEWKEAEAKLHAAVEEEHLRASILDATLASIPSAVFIYDADGVIIRVNDTVRQMIRGASGSFDPASFEKRREIFGILQMDGTPMPVEAAPYYRALQGETVQGEEMMLTRLGEEVLWADVSAAPIRNSDGAIVGAVSILTDITGRKRGEEALRRHTEELTRLHCDLKAANREANLYLDILTHDIGNTENVSRLYADLLLDTLGGEAAGYVESLRRSINRSIEILGNVSTIRRIYRASPELTPIDLDETITGMIAGFPADIIHYGGTRHRVLADDLLPVVFNNLIGNAVKHGGSDVEVEIRVDEVDGEVQISVEDTGPGVPDSEKDAIFRRYEQQKRGVGEGLGLYLVQILVEHYGGRIWVDDRVPGHPEEGAAFRFTLQIAQGAE